MNSETYNALKRVSSYQYIDRPHLKKLRPYAKPIVAEKIDQLLDRVNVYEDLDRFHLNKYKEEFRDQLPHVIKDDIVVTFLLFISVQVSEIKIARTFYQPGAWDYETQWTNLFKWLTFSVLTLMYDIKWKSEYFPHLDEMVADLQLGNVKALRKFMAQIGIELQHENFEAEDWYTKLVYHHQGMYGPYYWRLIHWMAEAMIVRDDEKNPDIALAKSLWNEFMGVSMYRTLKCPICMSHYLEIMKKYKERYENDTDYPKIWFDIHNEVNKNTLKTPYSEEEFTKDQQFMKKAL